MRRDRRNGEAIAFGCFDDRSGSEKPTEIVLGAAGKEMDGNRTERTAEDDFSGRKNIERIIRDMIRRLVETGSREA